ncbi:TnsA endonuclease N-terminal domain-containing protein [Limnobacter sp.]|uniref:TnsA endonuclease N-terminal domain-containing protein n=1 Tax=Limnobacter sp. TaxID=2003368 RepID=UPI002735B3DB|nr:TnsA endonuclease N-terminal domain-containing protein [Limnobacter sp.]MDP3272548.1 hypothetical protein [Limnobacter sp.]
MQAARSVVTRSPKRNVGLINCAWFQNYPIEHESRLEKHFVILALLCPGLIEVRHQPFRIQLSTPRQSYTPDFLLTFPGGQSLVVEVKRSERIKELISRFDEISKQIAAEGMTFFVVHQGQIEGDLRAHRARLVRRYAMHKVTPETITKVVAFVEKHAHGVTIKKLMETLKLSDAQLYQMIATRQIATDRKLHLSPDDLVYPITKEITDAAAHFGAWFGCSPWRTHA